MAKPRKVILKKSNVLLSGEPKLPAANAMEYGELAVNYAASGETLSIKNSDNQMEFTSNRFFFFTKLLKFFTFQQSHW